ncbi:MAG: hypothetical protein ACPHVX_06505, partial [Flavobacteriaceae bacterium]
MPKKRTLILFSLVSLLFIASPITLVITQNSLDVSEISDLEYINVQSNSDLVCIKATQDQISQLSITKSDYQIF